jgi:S-adenosylmethionine/arginine decarboxylase-like enzyme
MCINAGNLGCGVSTQTHQAARDLIHQFESLKVKGFACTREQGLNVLQQWRRYQLKAVASGSV